MTAEKNNLLAALAERLQAAKGEIHPEAEPSADGQPSDSTVWEHSWSVLWGPPGTGKTFTVGREVVAALAKGGERILVVSTTNKARQMARPFTQSVKLRRNSCRKRCVTCGFDASARRSSLKSTRPKGSMLCSKVRNRNCSASNTNCSGQLSQTVDPR